MRMSDVFISYARSTDRGQARQVADGLRGLGHDIWIDDQLPVHRAYSEVIEERLNAAKAVVVIWSARAIKSHWVRAEANTALDAGTLVQLSIDGVPPPLPFNQVQYADMNGWSGDFAAPGWRKVVDSVAALVGAPGASVAASTHVPPQLPSKPSVAVLPFSNLSGDPEQDYFADGMVEEIARALSRFKSLFVIGGASSLSFKGQVIAPQEAARVLGVRFVLEGSVRKAGNRVRISVKLIDAATGVQIWTDRFEDTLEDVFALQDKVALSVAGVIEPAVHEAEIRRASARPTENMGVYDLCLRALCLQRTLAKSDVLAALELLNRAIAIDPESGSALAMAALCHGSIIVNGWSEDVEGHFREAWMMIGRALKVAGDDADVLVNLSITIPILGGNHETAAALADRAMEINPGSSNVWMARGWINLHAGEHDAAFEQFAVALRLDPLSQYRATVLGGQGIARFGQRRFREAVPLLRQSFQLRPEFSLACIFLTASYSHLGDEGAAREAIAWFRTQTPMEIRDSAGRWPDPDVRELLLDGISRAASIPSAGGA